MDDEPETSYDYVRDIIDEIALEGLDGITLKALWLRLQERPRFILKPLLRGSQEVVWGVVIRSRVIKFYCLQQPRADLIFVDRLQTVDSSGKQVAVAHNMCEIYPHALIDEAGVLGSCSTYYSRIDICNEARRATLDDVENRWGNHLVMVADQAVRKKALIPPDFNPGIEIPPLNYCFLERIGKARYSGEVTQGKNSLQVITDDSKMIFYYRKFLSKLNLITKQPFFSKIGNTNFSGSLLHLTRFHVPVKSKGNAFCEDMMVHLKSKPGQMMLHKEILQVMGCENAEFKKLLKKYSKYFKSQMVPYRTVFPNAEPSEYKTKATLIEKQLRVVKVIGTPPPACEDEEEEEDEEEDGLLDTSHVLLDRTLLSQGLRTLDEAGPKGLTQVEIARKMGLSGLSARALCGSLMKKELCRCAMVNSGRQRRRQYFCKKYENSALCSQTEVEAQKEKLKKMLETSGEISATPNAKRGAKKSNTLATPVSKTNKKSSLSPQAASTPTTEGVARPESDSISTEIIVKTPSGEKSFLSTDLSDPNSQSTLTSRMLKRANIILEAVNTQKVITDPQKLLKIVTEIEEAEGVGYVIDRKTILRLLSKLENDGHVKIINVVISGRGKTKVMNFICHPTIDEDHPEVRSAIEQAKMKLPIVTKELLKIKSEKDKMLLGGDPSHCDMQNLQYDSRIGRQYGYKPKYVRMQIFHLYMFYLIYEYKGRTEEELDKEEFLKANGLDPSLADEMPTLYSNTIDWRMFIKPLPTYYDYPEGWALMSDLLLSLPLSVFLGVVRVPFKVPMLEEYINHPIKKHYPVRNLPVEISSYLTMLRKYIFAISEIVMKLGFIGLVQMGPQKLKEKDQIFLYLNRHACLLDTTTSEIGYNKISSNIEYEVINYSFQTMEDVEQYWYDLWNYAMHTNLGCRNSMTGQSVVVESTNTKKELVVAILPKSVEEAKASDVGYIPGDKGGASGLDSDMFVHLRRNWYWPNELNSGPDAKKGILYPPNLSQTMPNLSQKRHRTIKLKVGKLPEAPSPAPVTTVKPSPIDPKASIQREGWKSRAKPKKFTRIVKPKKYRYGRKPYYDQVDKEALRRMVKLRVDWTSQEDNLLLLCKVASLYMSPTKRRQIAKNFFAVREILHANLPQSKNKTSRACQRRLLYMMKNPSTAHSVYMCLEEIKQDPEIQLRFSQAVEKLDLMIKAQGSGPKGYQQEYDKIFTSLVYTLMDKLKTVATNNSTFDVEGVIPDDPVEFLSKCNVVLPNNVLQMNRRYIEVQNSVDIICSVINGVIHSSLCCTADKTSYSYQLFHVYRQYPDQLLRSVMTKLRSMGMVSYRKRYKRWKTSTNDCIPLLSSSPFQLSVSYVNILQTRFQHAIFSDSYACFKSVLDKLNLKLSDGVILGQETDSFVDLYINNGGICATMVELYSANFAVLKITFPSQLIVLDPQLTEKEDSYQLILKRFKEMISIIKGKKEKKSLLFGEDEEDDEEETPAEKDSICEPEEFCLNNKSGLSNATSRLALYMMRDEPVEHLDKGLQHAHDYFVLNPCKIAVSFRQIDHLRRSLVTEEKKNSVLNEIRKYSVVPQDRDISVTVNRLALIFHRSLIESILGFLEHKKELGATNVELKEEFEGVEELPDIVGSLLEEQIVLRSGSVSIRFVHYKFTKPWIIKSYALKRQGRERMDGADSQPCLLGFSNEESVPKKKPRRESTQSQGEPMEVENPSTQDNTTNQVDTPNQEPLSEEGPSGVLELRSSMVLKKKRKRKWVNIIKADIEKLTENPNACMKEVHVVIRPWTRIDGTLNRRVLDRLLGSVLGQCLTCPGITLKALQERFSPALQPLHTYELVEVLKKIGCVHLSTVYSPPVSLFSVRTPCKLRASSGFEAPGSTVVEVDILAVSKLGQFIGDKAYAMDYVEALIDSKLS